MSRPCAATGGKLAEKGEQMGFLERKRNIETAFRCVTLLTRERARRKTMTTTKEKDEQAEDARNAKYHQKVWTLRERAWKKGERR